MKAAGSKKSRPKKPKKEPLKNFLKEKKEPVAEWELDERG